MNIEAELAPLLKQDEVILWQGRPTRYFAPSAGAIALAIFGLITASGPGYGAYIAFQGGVFVSIAIAFMIFSLSVASHALLNGMLIRRWSHYALTNYRAFVMIDHPLLGVDTTDWPINKHTDMRNNGYNPMTITFAYAPRRFFGRHMRVIGFEHIDDGLNVFRVMMDVRDGLH